MASPFLLDPTQTSKPSSNFLLMTLMTLHQNRQLSLTPTGDHKMPPFPLHLTLIPLASTKHVLSADILFSYLSAHSYGKATKKNGTVEAAVRQR
jgi:hypothetical protein